MNILTAVIIIGIILGLTLLCCVAFGFAAFFKSFTRKVYDGDQIDAAVKKVGNRPYCEEFVKGIYWFRDFKDKEEVWIKSFDGLRLKGYYLKNESSNGKVMILCHGYRSFPFFDFSASAKEYFSRGFDLLYIVQRAHADSEGKYITFGINERFDLLKWIDYVNIRHNGKAEILLLGVSMGAATVKFALGEKLSENVKGAVCDCGFNSPKDILAFQLIAVFKNKHLARFMTYFVSFASFCMTGHFLGKINSEKTLKSTTIPVVFAHGKADDVVPFEMSEKSYRAKPVNKSFIVSDKAAHGLVYYYENKEYLQAVDKLIADTIENINNN